MGLKNLPESILIEISNFPLIGTLHLNKSFYSILKDHGSVCFNVENM